MCNTGLNCQDIDQACGDTYCLWEIGRFAQRSPYPQTNPEYIYTGTKKINKQIGQKTTIPTNPIQKNLDNNFSPQFEPTCKQIVQIYSSSSPESTTMVIFLLFRGFASFLDLFNPS